MGNGPEPACFQRLRIQPKIPAPAGFGSTTLVVDYLNLNFIEQSRQLKVTFASSLELVVFVLPSSSILPSALLFSATSVRLFFFCRSLLDPVSSSWLFSSEVGICWELSLFTAAVLTEAQVDWRTTEAGEAATDVTAAVGIKLLHGGATGLGTASCWRVERAEIAAEEVLFIIAAVGCKLFHSGATGLDTNSCWGVGREAAAEEATALACCQAFSSISSSTGGATWGATWEATWEAAWKLCEVNRDVKVTVNLSWEAMSQAPADFPERDPGS